jgi:hypothetical protein
MADEGRLLEDKYHDTPAISTEEVWAVLSRDDAEELRTAVIGVALHHEDNAFAENVCITLAAHRDEVVRGNALLGFGHLARRFRSLTEATVLPILQSSLSDPSDYVRGQAWAASDDATFFMGWEILGFDPGR